MKKWILISCYFLLSYGGYGQDFPEGIAYQAQVHSSDGGFLSDATIGVEFNIHATTLTGTIVWQERHLVTTNSLGHLELIIGQGVSTGTGTAVTFDMIDWSSTSHFLEMSIDEDNTGAFISSMTQQMMAVPYAFHAKTTDQKFNLSKLLDVDTSGIAIGDILKWNGSMWVAEVDFDLDSVAFAFLSDSSAYADTAFYALNCEDPEFVDSASYAYYADSVNYAFAAFESIYADTALYADTAGVALYAINNWGILGNDNVNATDHFIGTIDSVDLVFKSFNEERMRILANGRIGIGTAAPLAGFHVNNTDGALFSGTFGSGSIPTTGAGSRMMFYPKKAAFRSGFVTSNQWDDFNIGNYSFAAGYNTRATASYAVAFGFNALASGEGAFAVGNASISSGDYAFSAGHNPQATGDHSIALGRGAISSAESSIAIGYHPTADALYGLSLGNYTYAHGENSVAIGYHAQALHDGSFIFNDYFDPIGYVSTTAANQFMVKASGGTVFYTSGDLMTGVQLLPGAGAWSILSDRNRKENIASLNELDYLGRLDSIEVFSWSYKSQDSSITHIGPMAQDFYATFNLGTDSTTINSGDFDGVNLLLLKALNTKIQTIASQGERLAALEEELEALRAQRERLMILFLELEEKIDPKAELSLVGESTPQSTP